MASKRAWQQRMARPAAKPTPDTFFGTEDDDWGDLSAAIDALPPLADDDDRPAREIDRADLTARA